MIELMIVVAIVTVLAVIGVVSYRRVTHASHTGEGTHMIQSIRAAQTAFHSETGQYMDVSCGIGLGCLYPSQNDPPDDKHVTPWGLACTTCSDAQSWVRLAVHDDGPVRFGYATKAGVTGTAPGFGVPAAFPSVAWPSANNVTADWFVVTAVGDFDANGVYVTMMGTSWQKDILIANDGE